MDGPVEITQKPIATGETFTYEFTTEQAGMYFYLRARLSLLVALQFAADHFGHSERCTVTPGRCFKSGSSAVPSPGPVTA